MRSLWRDYVRAARRQVEAIEAAPTPLDRQAAFLNLEAARVFLQLARQSYWGAKAPPEGLESFPSLPDTQPTSGVLHPKRAVSPEAAAAPSLLKSCALDSHPFSASPRVDEYSDEVLKRLKCVNDHSHAFAKRVQMVNAKHFFSAMGNDVSSHYHLSIYVQLGWKRTRYSKVKDMYLVAGVPCVRCGVVPKLNNLSVFNSRHDALDSWDKDGNVTMLVGVRKRLQESEGMPRLRYAWYVHKERLQVVNLLEPMLNAPEVFAPNAFTRTPNLLAIAFGVRENGELIRNPDLRAAFFYQAAHDIVEGTSQVVNNISDDDAKAQFRSIERDLVGIDNIERKPTLMVEITDDYSVRAALNEVFPLSIQRVEVLVSPFDLFEGTGEVQT